jgi:hypothetical protein
MTGFNLPPGCSVRDLPGNSPEAERAEAAELALMEKLAELGATPEEYAIVLAVGEAAIVAARAFAKTECDKLRQSIQDERLAGCDPELDP